jgi:hypothetical protein
MSDRPDRDDVNPTARWIARGVWKLAFTLVVILIIAGIITAIER